MHAFLAAVAYVPMLVTRRGVVGADTKQYLYLDPVRLLTQAAYMWNPQTSMGTVTHQNIGYLVPMGPWYALFHVLGVPTWVAQRLWTGTLLFLAGAGVLFLLRTLALRGLAATVAALAYMLSPYLLAYEARESALLLPWVGLAWMIGLTARGMRRGGWRHPALFALVVLLVGTTNATSLVLCGLGPVMWILWELVSGTAGWRRAVLVGGRMAVLSALVSLWWVAGLIIEGRYGMNILRYTETIPTVARTTLASEVLRGLGYWFFYGEDKLGLYLPMAGPYMSSLWLLAVSYALPLVAFLSAFVVRWRHRAYFVALILVGTAVSVGAYPYTHPSPVGTLFKQAAGGSTIGLALRSTSRATPLVVLGTAVLLGCGVGALTARVRVAGLVAAAVVVGLVAADIPALWTGAMVAASVGRPEQLPSYWPQAASHVGADPSSADTRVLVEPGSDFAAYRWGMTLDPVLPGLTTRSEVARELVPYGSPPSADLLTAFDEHLQGGTFDPATLAPFARLISAGDVLLRSDLQFERYNTPRPRALWGQLQPTPAGLSAPTAFGTPGPSRPVRYPMIDETELGLPPDAAYPPPVSVFAVPGARPLTRAEGVGQPLLVDGDGNGVVEAASAGLLDGDATVLYSPSFAGDPSGLARAADQGADLVVTDTNRRQAEQFGTVRENYGYTEAPGETALVADPRDARLPLFPAPAGDGTRTVAEQRGVALVQASSYGNPITYTPENRADQALDGDLHTAWTVGAFDDPTGQFLRIGLASPVTTDRVNLVQPLFGPRNRWITRATLTFDGGAPVAVSLGDASRTSTGQTVVFPRRTFRTLQITIDGTNVGHLDYYGGQSGVGFAEVGVAGQRADEVLRLPTDLLARMGDASLGHRLTILMSRDRAPVVPPRTDPEVDLARTFRLPTARSFAVEGLARLSPLVPDDIIDRLVGTVTDGSPVVARSSGRLPGDPDARASSTLDGDPSTVWSPGLGPQQGNWLQYDLRRPVGFDHLSLTLVDDGRHSVPTTLTVSAGGASRVVTVPSTPTPTPSGARPGAVRTVDLSFAPLSGRRVRLTVDAVRQVDTLDYYSDKQITLPVAVAEVGVPGMPRIASPPAQLPSPCRSDLLTVDGRPVPVRMVGSTASALALGELPLVACGSAASGVALGPGSHDVRTVPGRDTGVDIDSLTLDSAPGGAPLPGRVGRAPAPSGAAAPTVTVVASGPTSQRVVVHHPAGPFWLVLGQSHNQGWEARVDGGGDLGSPRIVDGYANGWWVTPAKPGQDMTIRLSWTPQRGVWVALAVSAAATVACLLAIVGSFPGLRPWRRRRTGGPEADTDRQADEEKDGKKEKEKEKEKEEEEEEELGQPALTLADRLAQRPWRAVGPPVLVGVPLIAGALAAAFIEPVAGPAVAVAALVGLLVPYGRLALAVGSVGLAAAVGALFVVGQAHHRYMPEFGWAAHFGVTSLVAWLAVALLAVDAVAEVVSARRRAGGGPRPTEPPSSPGP
ncbi:MAG TPA: alpha-(1-_3)-arabinofuranosyltransferase family protein [Acidimicrobiales bacterium]|nr:alpha-(1->3)-arabinofuranosyltransferase family protein [Acidimicrobiales bacterium]